MVEKQNVVATVAPDRPHSKRWDEVQERSTFKLKSEITQKLDSLRHAQQEVYDLVGLLARTMMDKGQWSDAAAACQLNARLQQSTSMPHRLRTQTHEQ